MKKENGLSHDIKNVVLPAFSDDFKGRHGCTLHHITFDALIGDEVCAVYMEEPHFAEQIGKVDPFNLIVHSGVLRTPHGVVVFLVWQIAARSSQEVLIEQYLNPQKIATFRLISSAANQTHFKFIVGNNQNGEIVALVDFNNVFEFDRLLSTMATAIAHEPEGDFRAATQHAMDNLTITELLARSAFQRAH